MSQNYENIIRTFHPIGQGAFYSERHKDFNTVYDCGNRYNTSLGNKVVKQAFLKDEIIDILFISHFDYDHVNKIKVLKEHTKIKRVIIPLLQPEEKALLVKIYRVLDFNILTLIENPQKFFDEETQVTTIKKSNNYDQLVDDLKLVDIDDIGLELPSGSIISKKFKSYEWIYIPFNDEHQKRRERLETLLSSKYDVDRLKNDTSYSIEKTVENRKSIRNIYNQLSGGINQNSMLVYSGMKDTQYYKCKQEVFHYNGLYKHFRLYNIFEDKKFYDTLSRYKHRVSCIYTGDTDLNVVKIKSIFQQYWNSVGTIQIPHHGDIKSFEKNVLDDKYYWCPISVGKNTYGHPSYNLISEIMTQESFPILVTEELTSGFIEHIQICNNI